jgi:hypothetical protein
MTTIPRYPYPYTPATSTTLRVVIGARNSDTDFRVLPGTLHIESKIGEYASCSFTVCDDTTYFYQNYQPVGVYINGVKIFGGFIDNLKIVRARLSGAVTHAVRCTDNHYLAAKRVVRVEDYLNQAGDAIVADLWTKYMAAEGITLGQVASAPIIPKLEIRYVSVVQAMETICQRTNRIWRIDPDRKLYYIPNTLFRVPWILHEAITEPDSITVHYNNPDYRNVQYIRDTQGNTGLRTEYHRGDGQSQSFTLGYPVAAGPSAGSYGSDSPIRIFINRNGAGWVEETISQKGALEDTEWRFAINDAILVQKPAETALTSDDILRVDYYGTYKTVTTAVNFYEINLRKSREGVGTGIVEDVQRDQFTTEVDDSYWTAAKMVDYWGKTDARAVEFKTTREGLQAGALIDTRLPEFNITQKDFLIESLSIDDLDGVMVEYAARALEGPFRPWVNIFDDRYIAREDDDLHEEGATDPWTGYPGDAPQIIVSGFTDPVEANGTYDLAEEKRNGSPFFAHQGGGYWVGWNSVYHCWVIMNEEPVPPNAQYLQQESADAEYNTDYVEQEDESLIVVAGAVDGIPEDSVLAQRFSASILGAYEPVLGAGSPRVDLVE